MFQTVPNFSLSQTVLLISLNNTDNWQDDQDDQGLDNWSSIVWYYSLFIILHTY